jgi:hypothetical protein
MTQFQPRGLLPTRTLAVALVSGLCAMGFSIGAAADPEIVTESSGSYGPVIVPPSSGLMSPPQCAVPDPAQVLSPMVQTFHFVRKICDDRQSDGLPACGQRFTAYIEECSRPVADEYANGPVISRKSSGLYRICYNDESVSAPAAATDCRDLPPGVAVIATGTTQTHSTLVIGSQLQGGTSELDKVSDTKFIDENGKKQSWEKATGKKIVIHSTGQVSGVDGGCGGGGCGIASTGIGH